MEDVLVPLIVFLFVGAIILGPKWMRSRERLKLIEAMKELSEKGAAPAPELVEALQNETVRDRRPRLLSQAQRDMRGGVNFIAVALAILVLALTLYASHSGHGSVMPLVGLAAFPGFIGLARLGFWWLGRSKPEL